MPISETVTTEELADVYADLEHALRHEIASTIAQCRGGHDAGELATRVLDGERHRTRLIGLREECHEVVYYQGLDYDLVSYELALDVEFSPMASDYIGTIGQAHTVPPWVRAQGRDAWDWVHPQYRWVFETE